MAYVPGTTIDQPTVNLSNVKGILRVNTVKRELKKIGVPQEVITTFLEATGQKFGDTTAVDTVIAQYVVVA